MRYDRTHKIDDQANACRQASPWQPDAKYQAEGAAKFTSGKEWKIPERHADYFLDRMNYFGFSTDLGHCRKCHHRREEDSHDEICGMHGRIRV